MNASTTETEQSRIPAPINMGTRHEMGIDHLHHQLMRFRNGDTDYCQAERHACGFPLPSFQRNHRWDIEREIAFIEGLFLGVGAGEYTFHEADWSGEREAVPLPMSGWLLDGQQRLTAIERFFDDKVPAFGLHWSELNQREKRRFLRITFASHEVSFWNESQCRDLYNRLAFGGVAHEESERA